MTFPPVPRNHGRIFFLPDSWFPGRVQSERITDVIQSGKGAMRRYGGHEQILNTS